MSEKVVIELKAKVHKKIAANYCFALSSI